MDLYSLLACPSCKVSVVRQGETLTCPQCRQAYPIVKGVPILLPDGTIPSTEYQHDLLVRPNYHPWIHQVVMRSLPANAVIIDLGAGNLALNLPNVIRMDVTLTPYVDVVGDAHMMPFLPGTFDFVLSLAVIEHLRQPFVPAQEMYNLLRNGGYVYGDCNFVFAYHGYPHHYFNASQQGLEQVFGSFEKLRSGVAPYQMPSEAIRMLLITYLNSMRPSDVPDVAAFRQLLREVLDQPLQAYDELFTEDGALNVAAGVFFFGRKSLPKPSDVVPGVIQTIWEQEPSVRSRFRRLFDLGTVPNIMLWAKGEGRRQFSSIDDYFQSLIPFRKNATVDASSQDLFDSLPLATPEFASQSGLASLRGASGGDSALQQQRAKTGSRIDKLEATVAEQHDYIKRLTPYIDEKLEYIQYLESLVEVRDAKLLSIGPLAKSVASNVLRLMFRRLRH